MVAECLESVVCQGALVLGLSAALTTTFLGLSIGTLSYIQRRHFLSKAQGMYARGQLDEKPTLRNVYRVLEAYESD